ncbi:MAG: PTS transporter subunit IIC [Butyrivibrio sp.]
MNGIKKYLHRVFIDGLSGMALGLFATLIIGTIIGQIANFIPGVVGRYMTYAANIAKSLMGAGIGVGVACKYKESPLVAVSAAVAGLVGAFPSAFTSGGELVSGFTLGAPGNPLSSFIASYVAIEIGHLVSGKTPIDIIVTPVLSIGSGSVVAFLTGPYIARFTEWLGNLININVEAHPVIGGIVISAAMGMFLTLPISSAAIGVMLGLNGLAAGAATVGCCCQMIGFAVMSYKENKFGGLISQGIGTSMLQMPNIIKNPKIWIPPIISSVLLAPLSTLVFKMHSNAVGSGMGTSGLVGQFSAYSTMVTEGREPVLVLLMIILMHFVLPGMVTFGIAQGMRKAKWIKDGDLKLEL